MVTYDPSSKTAPITQYGNPTQTASLYPTTYLGVNQQVVLANGNVFMTQARSGSTPDYQNLVITRLEGPSVSTTHDDQLDHMQIVDGGHGMGLWIEQTSSGLYVWTSLRGQNLESAPRGGILCRFKYTAGDYHISEIPGGVEFMRQFPNAYGEYSEEIYNFDWAKDRCVERQFDFHTGNQELMTWRKISDVKAGVDAPLARFYVPCNLPTLQGFTTMNDTLFRWIGAGNAATPGQMTPGDPMAIEAWDWNTGQKIGYKEFPTLAQTNSTPGQLWKDGVYEPEGCSTFRESDGTASLIVGVCVGSTANGHRWPIYKFSKIGQA